jgi:hypothetical protein
MTSNLSATVTQVNLAPVTVGGVNYIIYDPAAILLAHLGAGSPELQFWCDNCRLLFPAEYINQGSLSPSNPQVFTCLDAPCVSDTNLCTVFNQWLFSWFWAQVTGGTELTCTSC